MTTVFLCNVQSEHDDTEDDEQDVVSFYDNDDQSSRQNSTPKRQLNR